MDLFPLHGQSGSIVPHKFDLNITTFFACHGGDYGLILVTATE